MRSGNCHFSHSPKPQFHFTSISQRLKSTRDSARDTIHLQLSIFFLLASTTSRAFIMSSSTPQISTSSCAASSLTIETPLPRWLTIYRVFLHQSFLSFPFIAFSYNSTTRYPSASNFSVFLIFLLTTLIHPVDPMQQMKTMIIQQT